MSSANNNTHPITTKPWLLYSYPWMPYPRRIQLYLREKQIPQTVITTVQVTDPQKGNSVIPAQAHLYPPRPQGSLPILAIPTNDPNNPYIYIRQSMAIISYLESATTMPNRPLSHLQTRPLYTGANPLGQAHINELTTLAEELTITWNPVRTFGSGAGTMHYPEGAREMFRWVSRILTTINTYLADRDLSLFKDGNTPVSIADIVLFQFLEFVDYCYGVDVTVGTGQTTKDVYGRDVEERYESLREFYEGFKSRKSARREEEMGECAAEDVLERMRCWHEGVW